MSDPAQLSTGFAAVAVEAGGVQRILVEEADFIPQAWHVGALVLVGDAAIKPTLHARVPLPVGCRIDLIASNVTPFTVDDSDVTVNSKAADLSVAAQWSGASLIQTEEDVWALVGDLA